MKVLPIPISKIQRTFRESSAWLRGFVGGRGSGKSKIGSIDISQRARPGEPWMAISPDNNMIRETTLPTFLETVNFTKQYISHVLAPTPRVKFRTRWGGCAELVFKGAEVPDKLRGPNKAGLWFDEASIISKDAFDIAIACCRYQGKMGPVLATFTPRGFAHWTFESFYDGVDESLIGTDGCSADGLEWFHNKAFRSRPDTFLVRCSTRDNPFAPPEYYSRIAQNYSTVLAMQELEGDFVEFSGMIFRREWFSKTVEIAPAECTRVRYWDKASSPDKGCYTVGLLMARDARGIYYIEDVVRGQWSAHERNEIMLQTARSDAYKYGHSVLTYVEQEGGGDGKTVADQLITMMSEFPIYRDVVSAGGKWKTKGNVRLPGDAKVRRAQPFAAQCEAGNIRLVLGSSNGKFHRDFCDELSAFPEYGYADQVDACVLEGTLITTGDGEKPVEQVSKGDEVLTRQGWKNVSWAGQTGEQSCLTQIRCNNGSVVHLTGNHPVFVVGLGWIQSRDVRPGNCVLGVKSLSSLDRDSFDIQSIGESILGDTFGAESVGSELLSIGPFGNQLTETYLTGMSSIMPTETPSIMQSKTLSALRSESTRRFTLSREKSSLLQASSLIQSDQRLQNGISLTRAGSGIGCMLLRSPLSKFQTKRTLASFARKNSCPKGTEPSTALDCALVDQGIMSREKYIDLTASGADANSWPQKKPLNIAVTRVVKVHITKTAAPVKVFNLSVVGQEEYFANGILIHNCSGAYNVLQRVAPTYSNQTATRSTEVAAKSRYGHTVQHSEGDSISRWSDLPWNQDNFEGQTGY